MGSPVDKIGSRLIAMVVCILPVIAIAISCATPVAESPAGEDYQGVAVSSYPHGDNWRSPDEHGRFVLDNGKDGCKPCHGEKYDGGSSDISCFSCHGNYPHPGGWLNNHGDFVLNNGADLCASSCHGTNYGGGGSGVSCSDCHSWP